VVTSTVLILTAIYLFAMASNRYTAKANFSIIVKEQSSIDMATGLSALLGAANSASQDTLSTLGFIQSSDLLLEIEDRFNLAEHFSAEKQDFVFNLSKDTLIEDRLEYYRKRILAQVNPNSGLIDLSVETYSPELSLEIAKYILMKTETFINEQNQEVATKQLTFAQAELNRTHQVIQQKERELITFQNTHKIVEPEAIIQAQLEAIQTLRLEKISREIELATLRANSPQSPIIRNLSSTIQGLDTEIKNQEATLSGDDQEKLNQLLVQFKELTLDLEFAIQLHKGAELMLETARTEAARNTRFFTIVQTPFLPEEDAYPRRWYLLISTVICSLLVFVTMQSLSKAIFKRG